MMGGCFSTSRTDGTEDSYHVSLRSLMAAQQTPLPSPCMARKIIERKLGLHTRKTLQARTNLLDTACHNLAKAKQRTLVSFPPSYYLKSDTPLFPLPLPPGYKPSTNNRNTTTKSSSLSKSSSISKSSPNSIKSKRIDVNITNSTSNSPTTDTVDVNITNSTSNFPATSHTTDVNSATSSFSSNSPRSPFHSQSNSTISCNSSCEALTPSSSTSSSVFSAARSSLSQSSSFSSSVSTNSSDLRCNSLAHPFENESSFFTPLPLPSSTHKLQTVDSPLKEFSALEIARGCDNFDDTYKLRDGSMGPFYKVYLHEEQSVVAIARVATKLSRKKWRAQIQVLASLAHPNLCKVIGVAYERAKGNMNGLEGVNWLNNTGFIVYESIGNESLEEYVQDVEKGHSHIDWSTRLKIAIGVAEGLSFLLHKMPSHVNYGELTMSNIMIDFSLNAKLFDFVLSSPIDTNKEMESSHVVQALGNVLLKLFDFVSYPKDGESQGLKERTQMEKAYNYPPRDAKLVIQLAASCLFSEDSSRPSIQHVACVLRNIQPTQHVAKFSIKRSKSFTYRKKESLRFD